VDDFDGDNINVVVRVRPLNEREQKAGDDMAIQFPGDGGIWVIHVFFTILVPLHSAERGQHGDTEHNKTQHNITRHNGAEHNTA
jgi:hypothetical protein